mgnify:CR=1 FL=1
MKILKLFFQVILQFQCLFYSRAFLSSHTKEFI